MLAWTKPCGTDSRLGAFCFLKIGMYFEPGRIACRMSENYISDQTGDSASQLVSSMP